MSKQNGQGRIEQPNRRQEQDKDTKRQVSTKEADKLQEGREKQPLKKPGQSNPGRQGKPNSGRSK